MIPDTPARIRARLSSLGARPRHRLGQHFLADSNVRDAVVAAAGIRSGDLVLEVGPGLGVLTRGLLDAGAEVLAVELDSVLAEWLESELAGERAHVIQGSAVSKSRLAPAVCDALHRLRGDEAVRRTLLVANLPYSISTPLLAAVARGEGEVDGYVVMVQSEVGDRMTAAPGTKDYGPLAVLLALRGRPQVVRRVGGCVFFPRARVRSAVVSQAFHPISGDSTALGAALARQAFLHRRKSIVGALRLFGYAPERTRKALSELGLSPSQRPETIAPQEYVQLGRLLAVD